MICTQDCAAPHPRRRSFLEATKRGTNGEEAIGGTRAGCFHKGWGAGGDDSEPVHACTFAQSNLNSAASSSFANFDFHAP
jgi:hypothetical protein